MAEVKNTTGVLDGVLFFVKCAQADDSYKKTHKEYSAQVAVSRARAKAYKKEVSKYSLREYDAEEFKERFNMESPFGEDEVYLITLRQKVKTKINDAGETVIDHEADSKYRPKVLVEAPSGERTDVTVSRLPSNGTVGKVSYTIQHFDDGGSCAYLKNILVLEDDFKEYIRSGSNYNAGDEFGKSSEGPTKVEPENKAATESRPPRKEKAKKVVDEDEFGDDIPF